MLGPCFLDVIAELSLAFSISLFTVSDFTESLREAHTIALRLAHIFLIGLSGRMPERRKSCILAKSPGQNAIWPHHQTWRAAVAIDWVNYTGRGMD
jgi:hypothetical protein